MPVSLLDFFILPVLRCFCGAVLFRSLCPSPNSSYPFWLLALTFRSSRPAFCGRLTSPVSPITRFMRAATCSSAPPCSKGFQAFLASSACAASATSYPSCSAASLPWPSAFRGLRPCPRQGAPFWPSGLTLRSSGRLRRRLPWPLGLFLSYQQFWSTSWVGFHQFGTR